MEDSKKKMNEINLPENIILVGNLIDKAFGNCLANQNNDRTRKERVIITQFNKEVSRINDGTVDRISEEYVFNKSYNSVNINDVY